MPMPGYLCLELHRTTKGVRRFRYIPSPAGSLSRLTMTLTLSTRPCSTRTIASVFNVTSTALRRIPPLNIPEDRRDRRGQRRPSPATSARADERWWQIYPDRTAEPSSSSNNASAARVSLAPHSDQPEGLRGPTPATWSAASSHPRSVQPVDRQDRRQHRALCFRRHVQGSMLT